MNKREFLKTSDRNILNVEISDTRDVNNVSEVCAFLTIGNNNKQVKEHLKKLSPEDIENNKIGLQQFEILLTKKHLKYLLGKIEKEERFIENYGCPSYLNK